MQSVYISGPAEFQAKETPVPHIGPGQLLMKTAFCAICGSDARYWKSGSSIIPGHEFCGYVEDPGSSGFRKGAAICGIEISPCGTCEFCKAGREELCSESFRHCLGVTADGAFSEYLPLRTDLAFALPEGMPMEMGALVEPAAIAYHALKRNRAAAGSSLLIWGNGPIGIYTALIASLQGIEDIVMVGRSLPRVEFANSLPYIKACISSRHEDFPKQLHSLSPAGGYDNVIDCVGLPDYSEMISCLKPGGTLTITGLHSSEASLPAMLSCDRELNLNYSTFFTVQEFRTCIDLINGNREAFAGTITNRIPHTPEAVQEAFVRLFQSGNNKDCKILIDYGISACSKK